MMIVFSALSYFGVHAFSWLIAAWRIKLARYLIVAVLSLIGVSGVKAYWTHGLVEKAAIEAATREAEAKARAEAEQILRERQASVEADARAEAERAAKLEEARRASTTPADPVVFAAGDGWLRGKSKTHPSGR